MVSLSVSRPLVRRSTFVLGFLPRSSHYLAVFFSVRSNFEGSCLTLWLQDHAAPRTRRLSNSSPVLGLSLPMCLEVRVTRVAPVLDPSPTSRTSPFFGGRDPGCDPAVSAFNGSKDVQEGAPRWWREKQRETRGGRTPKSHEKCDCAIGLLGRSLHTS